MSCRAISQQPTGSTSLPQVGEQGSAECAKAIAAFGTGRPPGGGSGKGACICVVLPDLDASKTIACASTVPRAEPFVETRAGSGDGQFRDENPALGLWAQHHRGQENRQADNRRDKDQTG